MYYLASYYQNKGDYDNSSKYYLMISLKGDMSKFNDINPEFIIKYIFNSNNEKYNLQKRINKLQKEIIELKYIPDAQGFEEAKRHYQFLSQQI